MLDWFEISGREIITSLLANKHVIDTFETASQNKFTFSVKYKSDGLTKLKNLALKVQKKEELYANKVLPEYNSASEDYNKMLKFTGVDLLQDCGIFGENSQGSELSDAVKESVEKMESPQQK